MADEWDDEDTGCVEVSKLKNNGLNNNNNNVKADDEWGAGSASNSSKNTTAKKTDDGWADSTDNGWGNSTTVTNGNDWSNNDTNTTWGSSNNTDTGFSSNSTNGNRRDNDRPNWICTDTSCAASNFPNRYSCFKCKAPKGDAKNATERPGGGGGFNRGNDWICTDSICAGRNFANRSECFKCKLPKGDAQDAPERSGGGGGGFNRGNDWICTDSSCAGRNFANRTECYKCKQEKGDAQDAPPDQRNQRGGGGTRGNDWLCSCGANNFGNRTDCFKCKKPKEDSSSSTIQDSGGWGSNSGSASNWGNTNDNGNGGWGASNSAGSGNSNGGGIAGRNEPRGDDWTCNEDGCNASNFASRRQCFRCKTPKPGSGDGGNNDQKEDWTCSKSDCNTSNFASRRQCFKCKTPRAGADGDNKPVEYYIPPEVNEDELFSNGISQGINFNKFSEIPVEVTGDNIPPKITTFEQSGLHSFLVKNITRSNYTNPTPIQQIAIPTVLNKRDLMGCAQTGSGKTAAFLLPMIHKLLTDERPLNPGSPHVLIMSPTRELAKQIYLEALKFAKESFVKCLVVYGGTSTRNDASKLGSGFHILVATPGRFHAYVSKDYIHFNDIRFVVLDEADRMLDMGFLPEIEKIMNNPTMPAIGDRQTLMFSATFPEDIQRLAGKFLKNYLFIRVGIVGGACKDVKQAIHKVTRFEKRNKLLEILKEGDCKGTIVFVETKRNADFLASFLSESEPGLMSTSIHGDRLQRQREEALNDFTRGKMKLLIATSVAARGLDIPNVCHVINYDMPKNIDEYVHRIGRTGRLGNEGRSTSFYDPEQDADVTADLIRILKQAGQTVPEFLAAGGDGGGFGESESNQFGGTDFRSNEVPASHTGGGDDEDWG